MKLSVAVITYNHEKYIEQTLDGIFKQKVDFDFEVIIGEDNSTDKTAEIIKKYENLYPGKLIAKYRRPNLGAMPNFTDVIRSCKGEYIALCEGDDYWTDDLKLQKQIDFLDKNKDYAICCHEYKKYTEGKNTFEDSNYSSVPETTTIKDLAKWCYVATNTAVIRNDFTLPDWFSSLPIGDWPLFLFLTKDKKIMKMNEQMSVYRIHPGGLWTSADEVKRQNINIKILNSILNNNIVSDSGAINNLKIKLITSKIDLLKCNSSLTNKLKIFFIKLYRSYLKSLKFN